MLRELVPRGLKGIRRSHLELGRDSVSIHPPKFLGLILAEKTEELLINGTKPQVQRSQSLVPDRDLAHRGLSYPGPDWLEGQTAVTHFLWACRCSAAVLNVGQLISLCRLVLPGRLKHFLTN